LKLIEDVWATMRSTKSISIEDLDFRKGKGLVPVIVQDYKSLEILTLAYVNREALEKTVKTGQTHFFRRSKGRVMKKGETSGNIQEIKEILVDCDHDSLIFIVNQKGMPCHLEKDTCFHNKLAIKNIENRDK
jgi:phosphoribosyl-AMP cyclohydrolase